MIVTLHVATAALAAAHGPLDSVMLGACCAAAILAGLTRHGEPEGERS